MLVCLLGGVLVLAIFVVVELKVAEPMFRLQLFRSRPFTMGNLSALLTALARGGLQFMLIIWLQGIWLPQHGYSFERTPLWAGIYLVPLTIGSLLAGPISGRLADRFGARPFATAGALLSGVVFLLFNLLPMDFPYVPFAVLLFLVGLSIGMFMAPNTSSVMNSLPADQRGGGAGMLNTFQNSAARAVHRRLLHDHHARPGRLPAARAVDRPRRARRARRPGARPVGAAPDRPAVRLLPGLQPDPATASLGVGGARLRGAVLRADRPRVLPAPDLRPLRRRTPPGLRHGGGAVLPRRGVLLAAGGAPRPCTARCWRRPRRAWTAPARPCARPAPAHRSTEPAGPPEDRRSLPPGGGVRTAAEPPVPTTAPPAGSD